jgi:geranylgeranyl pyrophosphate synthase
MIEPSLDPENLLTDVPGGLALLNVFALSGGKQFRPQLLLLVSDALKVPRHVAAPYAVAAERIHNATLLHDDVIDESTRRRGKPTLNALGQNQHAVLGGDLLLAEALRDLGKTENLLALQTIFEVLVELSEGEWLQLEARYHVDVTERHLYEVAAKKTGSLIAWCCATPSLLVQSATADMVAAPGLKQMGRHLGIAFQLVDDCLDFDSKSGKPFAQDLREGQVNFVTLDLMEHDSQWKPEFFSAGTIAQLSEHPERTLLPSINRTLAKAEREIASAEAHLIHACLSPDVTDEIHNRVLEPFLKQVRGYKERYL